MSLPPPPTVEHCYRHPDRETGRRCTRCGKPACSECLIQAQVGSHCVDCARAARPDIKTRVKYANAKQPTLMTYLFIAINVAFFIYTSAKDPDTIGTSIGDGRGVAKVQFDLGLNRDKLHILHDWETLVTSGFTHFGILHLLLNMYALYLLGGILERALGRTRFALLYMAALLGGSLGILIINQNSISAGASGAVFGLMAAAAVAMHRQGINILQTGIGRTLGLNLVITFVLSRYISVGGHIGGLVAGGLCAITMLAPRWKPVPKWVTYATPIAVGVLCVIASVVITLNSTVPGLQGG
jgi:membrane associated rhomboid family serine protease